MTYNEWLENEIKQLERDKRYWLDNFKRVRDDKMKLINENTKLQNDLFSEELIQDETEDYINKLKKKNDKLQKAHSNGWKEKDRVIKKLKKQNETLQQELFNLYLKHYN